MLTDPREPIDDDFDAWLGGLSPGDPPDDLKERCVATIERRRFWWKKRPGPRTEKRRFTRPWFTMGAGAVCLLIAAFGTAVAATTVAIVLTLSKAQRIDEALRNAGYMRITEAVLLISPDGGEASAYSKRTGTWERQVIAEVKGEKISPIVSTGVACFQAGDNVYAFSVPKGVWDSVKLPKGVAKERVVPVLTSNVACFQAGNRLYAFGAPTGKWRFVELPTGSHADPEVHSDMVIAVVSDRLYTFSATAGKWDSEEIEMK